MAAPFFGGRLGVPRPGKRQLNVWLTEESFDAWRTFCEEQGVSVTAMLEAMGLALAKVQRPSGVVADVVKEARRLDGERRRGTRRL
jgi:hypothetical protein